MKSRTAPRSAPLAWYLATLVWSPMDWKRRWQMCLLRATYDAYLRRRLMQDTQLESEANVVMARADQLGPDAAIKDAPGTWIIQERIPVRREMFPMFDNNGHVEMRDMLVDLAPYLFRGRMSGYLTRLSSTGLANVTSGGGQVPAFVIQPHREPAA